QVEQGGLAGAVGADQPDDPPGRDVQGAVGQRPAPPVPFAQSLGLDDGGHALSSSAAVRKLVMYNASMLSSSRPARRALWVHRHRDHQPPLRLVRLATAPAV